MSEDRFLELAPLAALGTLDGEDQLAFEEHLPDCGACAAELSAHQAVAGRVGLATGPVAPAPALRSRVLAAAGIGARLPASGGRWRTWLATAAALVCAVGLLVTWLQRERAEREAELGRSALAGATAQLRSAQDELAAAKRQLAEQLAFREFVAHSATRTTPLGGLPAAPGAQARVLWNPDARRTVIIASGLEPPPQGKAYELWVIAGSAPVPAGVFQVAGDGRTVATLPWVEETPRVKTFAVTLEPALGVPAPTGPMVLAGNVS